MIWDSEQQKTLASLATKNNKKPRESYLTQLICIYVIFIEHAGDGQTSDRQAQSIPISRWLQIFLAQHVGMSSPRWRVLSSKGLVVRSAESVASEQLGRLSCGAEVEDGKPGSEISQPDMVERLRWDKIRSDKTR